MKTPPRDRYGMPLSTRAVTAAEWYDKGIERWLSSNLGASDCFHRAIAADDGFAIAYVALAWVAGMEGALDVAKHGMIRARTRAKDATRWEQGAIEGITALMTGKGDRALTMLREQIAEFPRDVLSLSIWSRSLSVGEGARKDRNELVYAVLSDLAPRYDDDWWFPSALSFVCHELDFFAESRRLAERSLSRHPNNAGASHSLSHVFYETNDHSGGVAFLNTWLPRYPSAAPQFTHLSWHLALFELAAGHYARVVDVYERYMQPSVTQARTALFDAASLLWRLQIYEGIDRALPWQPVRDMAARAAILPGAAFVDVHAAMAYAATRDAAAIDRLIDGLAALAAKGHPIAGSVTLPLVRGLSAFANGAYDETIDHLAPIMGEIIRIGGSNAQREVFEDTLLQAYLRSERFGGAEALLRTRLGRRESARDLFWLGKAQAATLQPDLARASLTAARHAWRDADSDAREIIALTRAVDALGT